MFPDRRGYLIRAALLSLIGAAMTAPAVAQTSVYTSLDPATCTQRPVDPRNELPLIIRDCAGHDGINVLVAESDGRISVSYGISGPAELGTGQTLPEFNTIGDTLEWRLDTAGTAYATILRYHTQTDGGPEGQVLVVTRLGDASCHVAYVDALANPDANELARQAADLIALNFACDVDMPLWISSRRPGP